jgi:hypothetical protein
MPTRRPTISESARLVSSAMRWAAASVSFMTCGRGRGFGLAAGFGEAGVMSVIYSILAAYQCCFLQLHSTSRRWNRVNSPTRRFTTY